MTNARARSVRRSAGLAGALAALVLAGCAGPPAPPGGRYGDLVTLFREWREFQKPGVTDHVPDYTAAAMRAQHRRLADFQARLAAFDVSGWPVADQVDFHLVRAEMNGLDFDHRVLRPWSRNPCFYTVIYPSPTDVPAREGPVMHGAIELWQYPFPLAPDRLAELEARLGAIPAILDQAKTNLVFGATDLWRLGIREAGRERAALAALAARAAGPHPELVPVIERASAAVADFQVWLEARHKTMIQPSGIGVGNYDWYMKNVHLVPYTWAQQVAIIERELDRAWSQLKLEEARNQSLPPLEPAASPEAYHERFVAAARDFVGFLRSREIFTVPDYALDALVAREGGFVPPTRLRDFFTQVELRDSHPMRAHGMHWIDLARMAREPHPSPIRREPLLYNIWDMRAEGYATGMEELALQAGYLDDRPRARELVYIMLANRAARAMGDLRMHSGEFTLEEAIAFAVDRTPYGWLSPEGNTVWFDEQLYLGQPGYGTSYVVGKVHIDRLLADRARQQGERFSLRETLDAFHGAGLIPVSLIRWELTGLDDEVGRLFAPRR